MINADLYRKPDWLVSRNPLGKVPIIERDGQVIFESLLCNDWLEEHYPKVPLYPANAYERYKSKMLISVFDTKVSESFIKLVGLSAMK